MGSRLFKLGELCDISSSKRIFAKEYVSSGVPFFRGKEIIQLHEGNDVNNELFISEERFQEIAKKFGYPKPGDILLTSVGTLGIPYYVKSKTPFYFKDGNLTWFRNFNNVRGRYIYYWFFSNIAKKQIDSKCIGSTQKALTITTLKDFDIALPSLEEQDKVISILDSLQLKISINKKINDYLAELASLEFSRHFGPDTPTTELGKVLSISTKSLKPQDCIGDIWEHYSIPAYDENRRPIFEPAECIKSNKYIVDTNCILISKLNPTIKRIWMPACTSDHPVCSTEFIVYKPNNLKHKSFYYAAINAPEFTDYLLAHVTGSTGSRQRTQPKATLKYPMQAPSVEAIDEFCAFADPIYEQIKLNELESGELEVLRDTLLPKLISGEIDVSKVKLPKQLNNHLLGY